MDIQARIESLGLTDISEKRAETLAKLPADVSDEVFVKIANALRVGIASTTVVIPAHRLQSMSRGRGWARKGTGSKAEWGERLPSNGGYRVGVGDWSVGATDGYARKGATEWTVSHVQVGEEIWTVAY